MDKKLAKSIRESFQNDGFNAAQVLIHESPISLGDKLVLLNHLANPTRGLAGVKGENPFQNFYDCLWDMSRR
jgi:hypothetical protein